MPRSRRREPRPLRLSPDEYEQFAEAILQHGGQRARRGLRGQEEALMRIIMKVTENGRGKVPE